MWWNQTWDIIWWKSPSQTFRWQVECGWWGNREICIPDCYPIAQLNLTLHLYDKQLHLIQQLVSCHLSILSHLGKLLHYLSFLHPCILFFFPFQLSLSLSLSMCTTTPSPFLFKWQSDGEGGTICKTCSLIGLLQCSQTLQMYVSWCVTHVNRWYGLWEWEGGLALCTHCGMTL